MKKYLKSLIIGTLIVLFGTNIALAALTGPTGGTGLVTPAVFCKVDADTWQFCNTSDTLGDATYPITSIYTSLLTAAVTMIGDLDLDGNNFVLDSDGDSKIEVATDDIFRLHLANAISTQISGVAGTPTIFNDNSIDVDHIIETDNDDTFFVIDGGNSTLTLTSTQTGTPLGVVADSVTSGSASSISSDGLTTGRAFDITSTSTAGGASGISYMAKLARSGTNSNTAHTAYGVYSTVTNDNVTSGTNIAGYFSASGATTANYGLIVENGDVGIGMATPSESLTVVGRIFAQKLADGDDTGIILDSSTSTQPLILFVTSDKSIRGNIQIVAQDSGRGSYMMFDVGNVSAVVAEKMRIQGNGFVGIGTTSPDTILELSKDSTDTVLTISTYHDTEATTPTLTLRKADNTEASPAAIDSGAVMGTINFEGYDNNGFDQGAVIYAKADANWGATERGTDLFFQTRDGNGSLTDQLKIASTGTITTTSGVTIGGALVKKQVTISADDTTPDVSGGSIFTTSSNTVATAITDLDNPTSGQIVHIIGGSNATSTTIADGGNFNLTGAFTFGLDDILELYVQADNDYIEIGRSDN